MTTPTQFLAPVPMTRLLRAHLRIWRAQPGVLLGTGLALAAGLAGLLLGMSRTGDAVAFGQRFAASTSGYSAFFLVIGVIAGAAPFRSRWAAVVLVVAPRRLRWLAASFASVIVWTLGTTMLLAAVCLAAGTVALTLHGSSPSAALGVLTHVGPVVGTTLFNVTVGFVLGAAVRGITVPLILAFVVAPGIQLLSFWDRRLGRWIDLDATMEALLAGRVGLPTATALCLWVIAPALVAVWRLRGSPVP
jgi:hypothetical protein